MSAPGSLDSTERNMWLRVREHGDLKAREFLLERHLPYAKVVAATYYGKRYTNDVEFDDYLQLARMGLLEAFDRFDLEAGVQFRTFAARRMHGAILDGLAELTERQSQTTMRRRLLAERAASLAMTDGQVEATKSRLDKRPGLTSPTGQLFQYLTQVGIGLALGFMLDDTGLVRTEVDGPSTDDAAYRALELRQVRQRLVLLVDELIDGEREVIRGHYLQGLAFEEIAGTMALSKGRVSQIHKKAIQSLRTLLAAHPSCDRAF